MSTELDRPRSRWPWLSLLPLGIGAWAPIVAGVQARVKGWIALGALWSAITLAGWIGAAATGHGHGAWSGLLLILGWVGAAATSFIIRGAYEERMQSPLLSASEHAETLIRDRAEARALAQQNPTLAKEMGIGRPDLGDATPAGVVDVNNAPASALAQLAGVDDELATRIVEARTRVGGFSSVEDLGVALDLPGDLVERLRDYTVYLPR